MEILAGNCHVTFYVVFPRKVAEAKKRELSMMLREHHIPFTILEDMETAANILLAVRIQVGSYNFDEALQWEHLIKEM